jgi:hypothetical protein
MKTQTTQLSANQTKQVAGGLNLEAPAPYTFNRLPAFTWVRPSIGYRVTQAMRETGGMFDIVD